VIQRLDVADLLLKKKKRRGEEMWDAGNERWIEVSTVWMDDGAVASLLKEEKNASH
jgi:hypothetical protein